MAEGAGAQAPPTFKLVLVGDGGTGKVGASRHKLSQDWDCPRSANGPGMQTTVLFSSKYED